MSDELADRGLPLELVREYDAELLECYFKPMADYLKAKFEREANEWDAEIAALINEQSEPPK